MYNRYIPSANGSYVCHRVEDEPFAPPPRQPEAPPPPPPEPPPWEGSPREGPPGPPPCEEPPPHKESFLRRLLPRGIDLDDLLILLILLLLIMDSDEGDDSLTVLLTIGAFLILQ